MPAYVFAWLDREPDLLGLAAAAPEAFPFLLDSAAQGRQGGCSMLLLASGDCLLQTGAHLEGPGSGGSFFARLRNWLRAEHVAPDPARELELPFIGGWFVYLGYEMAGSIEPRLNLPAQRSGLPDAFAQRCPGAIIIFHSGPQGPARACLVGETPEVLDRLRGYLDAGHSAPVPAVPPLQELVADDPARFEAGVLRIKEYLRAGDVFQVNLSRGWAGRFQWAPDPLAVYRRLRRSNPAPFAGVMRWNQHFVLSSSPERLARVQGSRVETRPIAGTRARGSDPERDVALSRELIDNAKERAEHIMLIDLERNDLGRVCRPGSVEVSELMVVESHAHVHHIVSNVRGELRAGMGAVDVMRAVFPGGTITGCPKVRCMEIIAELEQEGRAFYTGSMGYLGRDGTMDLNILIRSMLLHGPEVSFRTGAGIVADSHPDRELAETIEKARGLMLALEETDRAGADA